MLSRERSPSPGLLLTASPTAKTQEEIARLSDRYAALFAEIRADLDELVDKGRMSRAIRLSERTGEHLNFNEYPAFFFGDLDASLVLAHLNPKQRNNAAMRFAGRPHIDSFEKYFDAFRRFGEHSYGPQSNGEHKSPFDHKQIRFLRPFGVIRFGDDTQENLRRVVDDKLQIELVPYGSSTFSGYRFPPETLREHFDRLMKVIAAQPRRYVIFCGAVFSRLLPPDTVLDEHDFHLTKADGSQTKNRARFANLRIPWQGRVLSAGLAHSFAQQGIPMDAYAKEVVARYQADDRGSGAR
jgi:hypothetical protein